MRVDSCFEFGHVIKIHGIKGEVMVFLDVDHPGDYKELESVFVEQKRKLVPFFIEHINIHGNQAIIKFEEVDRIEQARILLKCKLYLPLKLLPDLGKDNFYFHELIGFVIIDPVRGKLGKIKSIYEANGNPLIAMDYLNKEVLLPLNKNLVKKVDKDNMELFMDIPEGLLEIYLNP